MSQLLDRLFRFLRVHTLRPFLPAGQAVILDLGCGPRPWFRYLEPAERERFSLTAIDQRAYPSVSDGSLTFVQANIEAPLPFEVGTFDLVTMLAVLEHLNNPVAVLGQIQRVLRPNGRLLLTTPTWRAKPILELLAFRLHLIDQREIADHKRYFNANELRQFLIDAGFKIKTLRSFEFGCNLMAEAVKP